ncbi:MAG: hypothetical protein D6752_00525 [Candidatus Nitrosothermus koennekii]|nr:MAG: hypothetical protein D6752_00525 [Candidatus Nitrosothermus koennekii]
MIVYGLADDLPLEWLEMLDNCLIKEDLTIILDIDEKVMRDRLEEEGDLFESNIDKIKIVRRLYKELADRYGWIVIDANRDKEEVNKDIIKIIMEHL